MIFSSLKLTGQSTAVGKLVLCLRSNERILCKHSFQDNPTFLLEHTFDDSLNTTHFLSLQLIGKTKIPELAPTLVKIEEFFIDDLDMTWWFTNLGWPYKHYSNGYSSEEITDIFGGTFGFDGLVKFNFCSPVYSWVRDIYGASKFYQGH